MTPIRKAMWFVVAILVGAFVGFWTAFALFFTYPKPLGVWAHPFMWAAVARSDWSRNRCLASATKLSAVNSRANYSDSVGPAAPSGITTYYRHCRDAGGRAFSFPGSATRASHR